MYTLIGLGWARYPFSLAATFFPDWFPEGLRGTVTQVGTYFEAAADRHLVLLGDLPRFERWGDQQAIRRCLTRAQCRCA
jgi:hypothetical protein